MLRKYAHPCSHRLNTRADFSAVYDAKVRDLRGPLLIYAKPNGKSHLRLGFSTSRKVGIAAKRNRIRRMLREAFRLSHDEFPPGYDVLIVVKPHEPLMLDAYKARNCWGMEKAIEQAAFPSDLLAVWKNIRQPVSSGAGRSRRKKMQPDFSLSSPAHSSGPA